MQDRRAITVQKRHSAANITQHAHAQTPVEVNIGVVQDGMKRAIRHEFSDNGKMLLFIARAHEKDHIRVTQRCQKTNFLFEFFDDFAVVFLAKEALDGDDSVAVARLVDDAKGAAAERRLVKVKVGPLDRVSIPVEKR